MINFHRSLHKWLRALQLRTIVLFGIAAIASVVFAVIASEMREGEIDSIDSTVELAVHRLDSPIADVIMKTATFIGSDVVVIPVLLLVMAFAIHRRKRRAAIILAINAIVVTGSNSLLKLAFSRERPTLFDKIALPTSYSFPSGHSMSAMGIYGVVAAVLIAFYPRKKPLIATLAAVLIFTIGFSRIYLGVHWPFDVIGGFAGGVPPLVVSVYLLHRTTTPITLPASPPKKRDDAPAGS